jgi:ATP-dependent helicase HrpB
VRNPLPIDAALPELLAALRAAGVAVLHAPPGAGKTTRVPPALAAEYPTGKVVVLEPRRVAARAAARRIANEREWTLGEEVGWWIRFERRFRPDSRVVFVTEGLLLRWLEADPFLAGVAAVVFDEFHERALAADLALALARQVRREARPDLALVVMSATLDTAPLAAFLGGAPVVRSAGRLHPVTTRLDERADDRPLEQRVVAAVRRAIGDPLGRDGDLLVFLPGVGEIRRCEEALAPFADEQDAALLPLYGDLPIEAQDAALCRGAKRRIVLATNVAETSVTVEGVRAVVDSGLARQLRHDPASGLDRLDTVRVSRASADQRAGRAGREGPGLCLRLWTAADDLALHPFDPPEVRRVDLAGAALTLAAWGEPDPRAFEWFEAPEPARLDRALAELRDLGALDAQGITPVGRRLAALPIAPRLGRLVLEGERLGVAEEAALAAALLADRDPFRAEANARPHRAGSRSDLLDRLEALDRRRHRAIFEARDQILRHLDSQREKGISVRDKDAKAKASIEEEASALFSARRDESLLRAIAAAYLDRLCRRREAGSERAVMVGGRGVRLARGSAVRDAGLFVAIGLDAGRAGERSEGLVRVASAIERSWLPVELVVASRELAWDEERERVTARAVVRFDDLVLEEKEVPIGDAEAAAQLLAERAATELDRALALDAPELRSLRQRLAFLAAARPDLGLPRFESVLLDLLPAAAAGKRTYNELRAFPFSEAFLGALNRTARQALERDAPERLEVPSGSRIAVDYSDPARPVLAARIQELFGLAETPRLAGGRVPVLMHLLAPNRRPQQVTHDLASFWKNTYPQVRKELAGRYPKHAWPEDPAAARPERRPAAGHRRRPG